MGSRAFSVASIAIALAAAFGSFASAADHVERLLVRPSYGEMIASPNPCGPSTQTSVWRLIATTASIRIDSDAMVLEPRPGALLRSSDKLLRNGATTLGLFYSGKRTIVVAALPDHILSFTLLVESDMQKRDQVSCFERWIGKVAPR